MPLGEAGGGGDSRVSATRRDKSGSSAARNTGAISNSVRAGDGGGSPSAVRLGREVDRRPSQRVGANREIDSGKIQIGRERSRMVLAPRRRNRAAPSAGGIAEANR